MSVATISDEPVVSFPDRLRQERKRLGLTQQDLGRLGKVSKTAQWMYESGKHWPTVEYLEALRVNGFDVCFLATGMRQSSDRLDWTILRHAFLIVQHSLANRPDRHFTADQLFDTFRKVVEASMGMTRPDLNGTDETQESQPTEGGKDES